MKCFPNARISIGLNIIGFLEDGDPDIQSVYYPIPLQDELIVLANTASDDPIVLDFAGIEIPCSPADNLCWFAHHLISTHYRVPRVHALLQKNIPIGAGLGGASSDAAFFMRALNDEFKLGLAWGEYHQYARQLSDDCSFFVGNKPSFAEGRGDRYESILLDLSGYFILIVYPNIRIRSSDIVDLIHPVALSRSLENDVLSLPVAKWKDVIKNDLEDIIFHQHPICKGIKEKMYTGGALYAGLNGMSSCVYGIFDKVTDLRGAFPGCFVYEAPMKISSSG